MIDETEYKEGSIATQQISQTIEQSIDGRNPQKEQMIDIVCRTETLFKTIEEMKLQMTEKEARISALQNKILTLKAKFLEIKSRN